MEIFWLSDFLLERKIKKAAIKLDRTHKRPEWVELSRLLKLRSPRQIARMERQKGLA